MRDLSRAFLEQHGNISTPPPDKLIRGGEFITLSMVTWKYFHPSPYIRGDEFIALVGAAGTTRCEKLFGKVA
jgi:hypothetical protein